MLRAISSHQCGSGSNLGVDAICGLNLLLVLSFATRGVSPGTSIFPSPQKPTFLNTNLSRNQIEEEPLKGCVTSKSLFYLFIYLFIRHHHHYCKCCSFCCKVVVVVKISTIIIKILYCFSNLKSSLIHLQICSGQDQITCVASFHLSVILC